MKAEKTIRSLFDKLRPIVIEKLLSPEALVSPRGRMFFYDGTNSDDESWISPLVQLIIPLNDETTEILSSEEFFIAQQSEYHNVWYVYPDKKISLPWKDWRWNVIISLKTDNKQNYMLCISLVCNGTHNVVAFGKKVVSGSFSKITQAVRSDKFSSSASTIFNTCLEAVTSKIEESERNNMEARLFADTDITDYESVMKFVDFIKNKSVLKSKGHGIELFTYGRVVSLIDKASKYVNVLVDRDGEAQFCRLEDFPAKLLDMIRREDSDWNLGVHELSVGQFNGNGQAFVTWIISPYYYCPMDEDGFGEEEEYEVAVTCHINTKGNLVDIPIWKPYTGPRR